MQVETSSLQVVLQIYFFKEDCVFARLAFKKSASGNFIILLIYVDDDIVIVGRDKFKIENMKELSLSLV